MERSIIGVISYLCREDENPMCTYETLPTPNVWNTPKGFAKFISQE